MPSLRAVGVCSCVRQEALSVSDGPALLPAQVPPHGPGAEAGQAEGSLPQLDTKALELAPGKPAPIRWVNFKGGHGEGGGQGC